MANSLWDFSEQEVAELPEAVRSWVRHLKLRRRLYQAGAILPLVCWLGVLLTSAFKDINAPNPHPEIAEPYLEPLFALICFGLLAIISLPVVFSSTLQVSRFRQVRIVGYMANIAINLGTIGMSIALIHRGPHIDPPSDAAFFIVHSIWVLAPLSILSSIALIIANIRLAPYLKKPDPPPDPKPPENQPPPPPESW